MDAGTSNVQRMPSDVFARWQTWLPFAFVLLYVPINCLLSDSLGQMMFRTIDESAYFDSVRRLHAASAELNGGYAFSGTTYGYGAFYFIVLAATSLPGYWLGSDQLTIILMRCVNVLLIVLLC